MTEELVGKVERNRFLDLAERLGTLTPNKVRQLNVKMDGATLLFAKDKKGIFSFPA